MCEFCVKHGDGKRWYLNAANYAEELLHDLKREKYIEEFLPEMTANAGRWLKVIDWGRRVSPAATARILKIQSRRMKKVHFGQVIPLEDVESILGIVGEVVRLPCVCREVLEKKQEAVCYLLTASPDKLGLKEILGRREEALPFVEGMERMEPAEALREMASLEDMGKIHTVWTFLTPFIGGICNCDPKGCLAMNFMERGMPLYLRGEETASVEREACTGCEDCLELCLFGALAIDEEGLVRVDSERCQGCGVCRRACPVDALTLHPRPESLVTP
jgi:Pyruvate/2-oxoacid:ferredoxin oxidoreductase delta subunit